MGTVARAPPLWEKDSVWAEVPKHLCTEILALYSTSDSEEKAMRFRSVARALMLATLPTTLAAGGDDVSPDAGMLRYPDVSATHIVFVYANDLWLAPREGGLAQPLASPTGREAFPRFSPDGSTIAFLGNYEGNPDLYTVPTRGGIAYRVTHHPSAELLCDWTPDGQSLLFSTDGFSFDRRAPRLFQVKATGGLPEPLPVPYGAAGALSADGAWLAYTPHNRDTATWKRYRGGDANDIWLFHLEDHISRQLTSWEGTDTQPMWHGDRVYYLSDAGPHYRLNLWSYHVGSGERTQLTEFSEYDVQWPSMGPGVNGEGEIVFQNGSDLYRVDLRSRVSTPVDIRIPGDRPQIRPHTVDVSKFVQGGDISSTGKRVVVEARGDIWTLPAENGLPRNLTATSGVAERDPSWSPDGRWIAYFSDATGEYELYVTQSDGRGETRQLTSDSRTYYYSPTWAPDSEKLTYTDKAGNLYLYSFESGESTVFDTDPMAFQQVAVNWSSDSRWLTYAISGQAAFTGSSVILYDVENKERHQVTSDLFNDTNPVFDRKGEWLYFGSNRAFDNPVYGDLDLGFVYPGTAVLLAVPLRNDIKSPWIPEVDEETWEEEKASEDEAKEPETDEEKKEESPVEPIDDGLSGTWEGNVEVPVELDPRGTIPVVMQLTIDANGSVSGTASLDSGPGEITSGTFDRTTGKLNAEMVDPDGMVWEVVATVRGNKMTGKATLVLLGLGATFELTRTSVPEAKPTAGKSDDEPAKKTAKAKKEIDPIRIDLEGFEARAIRIPVASGNFGTLAVNHAGALIYSRVPHQGQKNAAPKIQIYDIHADKKSEKDIATGSAGFAISADGKQLLVQRGNGAAIHAASAGSTGKNVPISGMNTSIDPREEWAQIFHESWRLQRDFFYDPALHGVDWERERVRYAKMLPDCASREDVGYVIAELISELNAGHAYYGGGDIEQGPNVNVGLLGVDLSVDQGAYRIDEILGGGPWDVDARGPLSQPGLDVAAGDYLLAINGQPLDPSRDPWASLQGLAGKTVTLTVSKEPKITEAAREIHMKPIGSEAALRYRSWVEKNRRTVEEKTGGRVGYIHVPDTGVNGQNNLVRQFYGQIGKQALIVDERWNAGGQIPTRFIEILNRPRTNYWARRDGATMPWPPDSHQGPKCMLINGKSGSGGDAFPHYFRWYGLGKLIGRRTWGGLIGLSGNPTPIDGAFLSVPTFGFYETDGTWGIEGHGVEPDIDVLDDPAKMVDGGDPQLETAITHMLEELEKSPYKPAPRPPSPDRAGMGLPDSDK